MFALVCMLFVFVSLGVPAGIIAIPWTAITGDSRLLYRWGMWITALGARAAGIRVRVIGVENVPTNRAAVIMSNHVSNIDPTVLLPNVPGRTSVFIKKELMSIPVLGTAMRVGGYVPVTRGHSREDAVQSVETAAAVLRTGMHITLFPEGTRSPDGKLLPFKKGGFFLAMQTGAPIVPVAIQGTERMMPKGRWKLTPGMAVVRFMPPVDPAKFSSREELISAVRAEIERGLEMQD